MVVSLFVRQQGKPSVKTTNRADLLVLKELVEAGTFRAVIDRRYPMEQIADAHPFLGVLGVMSAKNTAVNLMILTTFLSFLMYRRANQRPVVSWARTGTLVQATLFVVAAAVVLFYGVYGYFVTAIVRIGFSVYQVLAVLATIVGVIAIDVLMLRGAESRGEIRWGRMPPRSQYALFVLVVTFTWLMGLMGFARSGIRQHWHVYEVMRDTSPDAATPARTPGRRTSRPRWTPSRRWAASPPRLPRPARVGSAAVHPTCSTTRLEVNDAPGVAHSRPEVERQGRARAASPQVTSRQEPRLAGCRAHCVPVPIRSPCWSSWSGPECGCAGSR